MNSCEISLFITAANREAISLVTYASNLRRSLGATGGESVNSAGYSEIEQPIRGRKKILSTVLEYTKYKQSTAATRYPWNSKRRRTLHIISALMKMYTKQYTLLETVPAFTIVEAMQEKENFGKGR